MTPESAYSLGFLWGDGYILKNGRGLLTRCEVISTDASEIAEPLRSLGHYCTVKRKRGSWQETTTFHFSNKALFELLESLGFRDKATRSLTNALAFVPSNLQHYFWRGYFDADGCFYLSKCCQIAFAGAYDADWSELLKLCKELNVKVSTLQSISKKGHKASYARITNRPDCAKFLLHIYYGQEIGLSRKRVKAYGHLSSVS